MSTSSEVTVLLMLEAIDKASQIIEGISGKLDALGEKAQAAAEKASLTGEELEAAQVKAEAAANAYAAAVEEQEAAQARLLESTQAVRDAQDAASAAAEEFAAAQTALADNTAAAADITDESYERMAEAAKASADATKAAVAEQVAALDALKVAQTEVAARAEESAAAQDAANVGAEESTGGFMATMGGLQKTAIIAAAAVAGIGYESVKAAANFQSATAVLVTSGGETAQNIGMVRQGILNLASSTGTATTQLINGMYMIGSAGYTGATGLNVLKAAAQGAKAENADLGTVSNALTTVLKDYYGTNLTAAQSTRDSTAAMDQMIAVVQNGKTTTEALSGALSTVIPIAHQAGLNFDQVGGAIATMTGEGMSAQQATQDLASTITHLQNPSETMVNEMAAMGLNATNVQKNLGKEGLTGTIAELTGAITAHMGPAGTVLQNAFNQSSAAAQDAQVMFAHLGSQAQSLAKQYEDGSIGEKAFRTEAQSLGGTQGALALQFEAAYNKSKTFNSTLTSGSPAAQTYIQALAKMTGTSEGLTTALALSGGNAATFQENVKKVGDAATTAGANVDGWSTIQGTMNQKLSELKESVAAAGITLGTALLPMLTKILGLVMSLLQPILQWIEHNKTLAAIVLIIVGALATLVIAINLGVKAMEAFKIAMAAVTDTNPILLAIMAIAVVALLIVTHWNTVKKWLSDFWDWFKGIFNDAKDFVAKWWPELLAPITGGMSIVVKFIMGHWTQIVDFLKKAWGDLVTAWNDTGGKAVTAIVKAFDWVRDEATKAIKGFVNDCLIDWGLLEKGWDATGGKVVTAVAHAWDRVSAAFSKEWSKISGDLSSIWGSLVTIWNATGGALISTIETGVEDVVSFVETNWGTITQVFEDVLKPVETVISAQWDVIKAIFTTTFGVIKAAAQAGWDVISGIFKAAWDVIRGIVQVGWDIISGIFTASWDVISGIVRAGWDVISGIFQATWDVIVGLVKAAWDGITSIFNIALDVITGAFKVFADLLTGKWGKMWDDIKSTFTTVWNDISGFFKKILGDIGTTVTGAVSSIFGGFEHGIEDAISGIGKALTDVWHAVVHAFDDAGTWLLQAGKDIIGGLVHGIEDAIGGVESTLKGLTHDITSWKGPPSTDAVLLTANGKLIMQGLITGIDSQTEALHSKLGAITTSIAADVTGGTRSIAANAASLGPASNLGTGGTVVNLTNQFTGNQIMSDSDITKFAQFVGKQVVTQIGPQGGNKILLR